MSAAATPQARFPEFYRNPAIRVLSRAERWTVSGRLGDDPEAKGKAPIDIRHLLDVGRVRGAWEVGARCLVTLDELAARLPAAANCAFYLQAQSDGFVVVDVEPDCPEEIARDLLALPGALYSETSMSGRGFHLLYPRPTNFHDFPVAASKRVLREEHGWYEILLEHWVTFTRRPVAADVTEAALSGSTPRAFASFEELYASLATSARASSPVSAEVVTDDAPAIKGAERIVARTVEGAEPRFKTLEHFNGDRSRWEFSILGTLYREMRRHLVVAGFLHRAEYSPGDRAWLLYEAARRVLPERPKHRETRNGRPFLLDRAAAMVATSARSSHIEIESEEIAA